MVGVRLSRFVRGERGIAESVGYVFALGLMGTFVILLLTQGASVFEGALASAENEQITFNGEQIAEGIESVDREVRSEAADGEVRQVVQSPGDAGDGGYLLAVTYDGATDSGEITMTPNSGEDSIVIEYRSVTPVEETEFSGASVEIVKPTGGSEIKINPVS